MEAGIFAVFIGIIVKDFMEEVISVKNLSKRFKSRGNKNIVTGLWRPDWKYSDAVKDVSFGVARGESVAFLGPNGAGKTTTTKMMTGLMYPSTGEVKVLGYTPFDRKKDFLSRIGLVMGNKAGLNWDLTAKQSFWLLQNIYGIEEDVYKKRLKHLAKLLNVEHKLDDQVRRLSLGERMKVELIGAILHDPEILFLDEPTIGLDIEAKKAMREFLRTIQKENGTTLIMTSHDMDDIEEVSDRVIVINQGQIAYDDKLDRLMKHYNKSRYIRFHFKDEVDSKALKPYGKVIDDKNGVLLKLAAGDMVNVLAKVPVEYEVEDINIESIPLETIIADIFAGKTIS